MDRAFSIHSDTKKANQRMDKLVINGLSIDPRVTTKQVRRLKSQYQIDLADVSENSLTIRFSTDATVALDIAYALYGDKIPECKSQDDFDNLIDSELERDPEFITQVRKVVSEAVSGFFPLLKTISTTMASVQAGVLDQVAKVPPVQDNPSGTTS